MTLGGAGGNRYQEKGILSTSPSWSPSPDEAKPGNYDPAYLVDQVAGNLTHGAFDLTACQECETEFIIVKSGKKQPQGGISIISQ